MSIITLDMAFTAISGELQPNPGDAAGGNRVACAYAMPDGNSVAYFISGTPSTRLDVYVYDIGGRYTWYAFINTNADTVVSIFPFGGGNFLVSYNESAVVAHLANAKLNNAAPILINQGSQQAFYTPCYNEVSRRYYDAATGVIGVASYDLGEEGGQVYSATFAASSSGIEFLEGGDVGYMSVIPPGPDPWDQTTALGSATANQLLTNGANVQTGGNPIWIAQRTFTVVGGGTSDCITPNGSYVRSQNSSELVVNPSFPSSASFYITDSSVPGVYGYSYGGFNTSVILVNNAGLACQVIPSGLPSAYGFSCALSSDYLFIAARAASTANVYLYASSAAPLLEAGFGPSYNLSKQAFQLVNSARPISLLGAYKA